MNLFPANSMEANWEIPTSIEGMQTLLDQMKVAIAAAKRGQTLRVKVHNEICLVVRELDIKPTVGNGRPEVRVPTSSGSVL